MPSKASYKKTGGGDKEDEVPLDKTEEQIISLIGDAAIHGHEGITEAYTEVLFLPSTSFNIIPETFREELPYELPQPDQLVECEEVCSETNYTSESIDNVSLEEDNSLKIK